MKKTYMTPRSIQLNMETEQMIAASGLKINSDTQADQWSNKRQGWGCDIWSNDIE